MGSGKKFRVSWETFPVWAVGVSLAFRSEHEISIHIELVKVRIYIGFGRGYEEFELDRRQA